MRFRKTKGRDVIKTRRRTFVDRNETLVVYDMESSFYIFNLSFGVPIICENGRPERPDEVTESTSVYTFVVLKDVGKE